MFNYENGPSVIRKMAYNSNKIATIHIVNKGEIG